ncbi:deoxyribose-phosphate aldolase [Flagelloscypha sp. PMI_526]|nr:deoxyribose-phosphate aldolase [Flagelloscypha sp. PMI_526]
MDTRLRVSPFVLPNTRPFLNSSTLPVTLTTLSKMIDHFILHLLITDDEIRAGLELAKKHNVTTACIKPCSIPLYKEVLQGSDAGICPVIGFPAGNGTSKVKVFHIVEAVKNLKPRAGQGGKEIHMVVNIGKEIRAKNDAVVKEGGFEVLRFRRNANFMQTAVRPHIRKLCEISSTSGVSFVMNSTGYGFVKGQDGKYSYQGTTCGSSRTHEKTVKIKAAGGIGILDGLLRIRGLELTRAGATATESILEEAKERGIGMNEPVEIEVEFPAGSALPKT